MSSLPPTPCRSRENRSRSRPTGSSGRRRWTPRIGASVAKGLTRFVGRKREIETLREAFAKVESGEGQVVGLVGEAGVGKSRLLLEFRSLLPQGEYTYLEGQCLHYGGSMPYLPMLDILRSFLGVKEGEPEFVIRNRMKERILGLDENLQDLHPALSGALVSEGR